MVNRLEQAVDLIRRGRSGLGADRHRQLPHEHRGDRPARRDPRRRPLHRARPGQRLQPVPARRRTPGLARLAGRAGGHRLRRLPRRRMPADRRPAPGRHAPCRPSCGGRPDDRHAGHRRPRTAARGDRRLRAAAIRVLLGNWTGTATVPSRSLYPHQWSWDSAFIAIGLRHLSPRRAQRDLESLLGAQWRRRPGAAHRLQPRRCRPAPTSPVPTSGAPPPRAAPPGRPRAGDLGHRAAPGARAGRLAGAPRRPGGVRPPRLPGPARTPSSTPGTATWPPAATSAAGASSRSSTPGRPGLDNSPCWDEPLRRVDPAPEDSFRRADLDHGTAADRPTDLDYAPLRTAGPRRTATTATTTPAPRTPSGSRTPASTRCSSPPSTRWPTSRGRSAPTRAAARGRAERLTRRPDPPAVGRRARHLRRPRPARRPAAAGARGLGTAAAGRARAARRDGGRPAGRRLPGSTSASGRSHWCPATT